MPWTPARSLVAAGVPDIRLSWAAHGCVVSCVLLAGRLQEAEGAACNKNRAQALSDLRQRHHGIVYVGTHQPPSYAMHYGCISQGDTSEGSVLKT
jgi:hypothetical protein